MAVSTDEKRAFIATGAAIAVVDVDTITSGVAPPRLASFELPDCAAVSMVYDKLSNTPHRLFIAGGTNGLWRVDLCPWYFDPSQPPCGDSYYSAPSATAPVLMDLMEGPSFERARCVDLCIVPNNTAAGGALLLAVFASRSDTLAPPASIGPSQLRAYKLNNDAKGTWTPYGTPLVLASLPALPSGPAATVAIATAIAADPGDPNHVYVALNKDGLVRVDISGSTFSYERLARPGCALSNCTDGEAVRDLAIARSATQGSFLYAAFEYAGVVEYRIATGSSPSTWQYQVLPPPVPTPAGWNEHFTERVAAVGTGTDLIYFAAARQGQAAYTQERSAPFRNTGHWDGLCLAYNIPDPNGPGNSSVSAGEVDWYSRDTTVSALSRNVMHSSPYAEYWGSLLLRKRTSTTYRLYACSEKGGTVVRELNTPSNWTVSGQYLDRLFAAGDGVVSTVNPGIVHAGLDGPPLAGYQEAGMLFITPGPVVDIVPLAGTLGVCGGSPPLPSCGQDPPNPFVGGLLGGVRWTYPASSGREWFLAGDRILQKGSADCASLVGTCDDPCTPTSWSEDEIFPADTTIGWRLASMTPAFPSGGPVPTFNSLQMQWWQLSQPSAVDAMASPDLKSESTAYVSAMVVPGGAAGMPKLMLGMRHGSRTGLKILRMQDVMNKVLASCGGIGNGQTVILGENLGSTGNPIWDPPFDEPLTHIEFEDPGPQLDPCVQWVPCGDPGHKVKLLPQSRGTVARVTDDQGAARWIALITTGFVAAHPNPQTPITNPPISQSPACQWEQDFGSPMAVVFDVTDAAESTPGTPLPPAQLLRVLLGPPGVEGYTWCVRTKTYVSPSPFAGKTFAFVGDMYGHLWVHDISGGPAGTNQLYPPASNPYRPPQMSSWTPTLRPVGHVDLPRDPMDGSYVNFVDIEIDGDWAYCATGRGGVFVINISNPTLPTTDVVLDTPGLALGVTVRVDAAGNKQLVVGDSLCGMRLYSQ